ncbi:MAG TPA: hypothetical protein VLG76_04175, partial [Rhabdochlamydiaceae bacterium]|nr:hypothetical protein [Rhabdochlamydiaceae bacterium]
MHIFQKWILAEEEGFLPGGAAIRRRRPGSRLTAFRRLTSNPPRKQNCLLPLFRKLKKRSRRLLEIISLTTFSKWILAEKEGFLP